MNWAVWTFLTWQNNGIKQKMEPLDGLSCRDPGIVSFVMCTFVLEFRKVDK